MARHRGDQAAASQENRPVDAAPLKLEGIPLELKEVAYWSLCERQIIPRAGDPDAIEPGIARG